MVSLPEIIPPGEYVIAKDHRRDRIVLVVYPDHQRRADRFAGVRIASGGTMSVGVYVVEADARHLLAMPGRPHDDRPGTAHKPSGVDTGRGDDALADDIERGLETASTDVPLFPELLWQLRRPTCTSPPT